MKCPFFFFELLKNVKISLSHRMYHNRLQVKFGLGAVVYFLTAWFGSTKENVFLTTSLIKYLMSPSTDYLFYVSLPKHIYCLLILGCAGSWLFSTCGEWGLLSSREAWDSRCGGVSWGGSIAAEHCLWVTRASVVAAHGLRSSGTQSQLFCSMWDLPRPGIESVSPALAGWFFTTEPPGKPYQNILKHDNAFPYWPLKLWYLECFCLQIPSVA